MVGQLGRADGQLSQLLGDMGYAENPDKKQVVVSVRGDGAWTLTRKLMGGGVGSHQGGDDEDRQVLGRALGRKWRLLSRDAREIEGGGCCLMCSWEPDLVWTHPAAIRVAVVPVVHHGRPAQRLDGAGVTRGAHHWLGEDHASFPTPTLSRLGAWQV